MSSCWSWMARMPRSRVSRLTPTPPRWRCNWSAPSGPRLLSTKTGGTMWRSSSAAQGTVGRIGLSGALPSIAMRDKEEAYGEVVGELVNSVTRDLRPTWVKQ